MKILQYWSLPDDEVIKPHIILPHGYGLDRRGRLPLAAKLALQRASELLRQFPQARLVLLNSNHLWLTPEYELRLKLDYLKALGADMTRVDNGGGVCSTLEEISAVNRIYDLANYEVVSIGDWIHARRIRYFWRKLFPLVSVKVISVRGRWDKFMPSLFQQSDSRWLLGNILHLILFFFFRDRIARLTHPIRR